jgi:hypothetical protein
MTSQAHESGHDGAGWRCQRGEVVIPTTHRCSDRGAELGAAYDGDEGGLGPAADRAKLAAGQAYVRVIGQSSRQTVR